MIAEDSGPASKSRVLLREGSGDDLFGRLRLSCSVGDEEGAISVVEQEGIS